MHTKQFGHTNINLGGVTENFEFKMDDDTEVYRSCSATLNGELFVFGGSSKKKQVKLKDLNLKL